MKKKPALMLGITSGVVIVGGIIMAVLLYQMVSTVAKGSKDHNVSSQFDSVVGVMSGLAYLFGLVYIVPGIFGVIGALVQNKCMYITTCIFSMISIVIMGIIVIVAGLAIVGMIVASMNISEACTDDGYDGCRCRAGDGSYQDMPFKDCSYFESFVAYTISLLVFIILTWVVLIMEFIVCCYFLCQRKTQAGMVINPAQQPMIPGNEMVPPGYHMDYPLPAKV